MIPARRGGASVEAIEAVYRVRFRAFSRAATAIVGDRELGRELVQDAFAKAVERRGTFRGDATVERWLWSVVLNTARNGRGRSRRHFGEAEEVAPSNGAAAFDRHALRTLVADLPDRQKLVLFLRYYADLDYREIAAALGVAEGTVAATLNAARGRLRPLVREVMTRD